MISHSSASLRRSYTSSSSRLMRKIFSFAWNSTRGHRLAPWRSPYLKWRIETYTGLKMDKIGFFTFWGFLISERHDLARFLKWTAEMQNYARPKPRNP